MIDNYMLINRLRVSGELGCDYKLFPGVNIFKGSNSTGKTSLMWFIDFIFGSSAGIESFISPIREKCELVYADLTINGKEYTIKRDLREPRDIYVYEGHYETLSELNSRPSTIYGKKESKTKDSLTNFFFKNLNISPGKAPVSSSKVARYSWRNMMSLVYVPQDKWNGIQAQNNFQPLFKKAIFEILMGIDDENINKQEEEIRVTKRALDESKISEKSIKEILDKMNRELGSKTNLDNIQNEITKLEEKKEELVAQLELKDESQYLVRNSEAIQSKIKELDERKRSLSLRLEELQMINSENELNLEKNRLLLKAKKIFSEIQITKCPKCLNSLKKSDNTDTCFVCGQTYNDRDGDSSYAKNLFLFMDDRKELDRTIESTKNDLSNVDAEYEKLRIKLREINRKIDVLNKEIISPVMKEYEILSLKQNELNKLLGESQNISQLLDREKIFKKNIKEYNSKIKELERIISDLKKDSISVEEVKSRFLKIMDKILVNELNLDEKIVDFDELYNPIFEDGKILLKAGREDINKSKGIKVILGYYTAVLEYSLKFGSYHPNLLILDTPHQDELDMPIFSKILKYWNELSHYGKQYQIIVTGSEFPANAARIIEDFHNQKASGDDSKPDKFSVYPIELK